MWNFTHVNPRWNVYHSFETPHQAEMSEFKQQTQVVILILMLMSKIWDFGKPYILAIFGTIISCGLNVPCNSKVFFSNIGPLSYREFYKTSIFYLAVCPSVFHFDIFLRNCSLAFSSERIFEKSSYFWGVLNIFENLQNLESYIHHSPTDSSLCTKCL